MDLNNLILGRPSCEGRGLKYQVAPYVHAGAMSSLMRGTWIEIKSGAALTTVLGGSSLMRGTWIEISKRLKISITD